MTHETAHRGGRSSQEGTCVHPPSGAYHPPAGPGGRLPVRELPVGTRFHSPVSSAVLELVRHIDGGVLASCRYVDDPTCTALVSAYTQVEVIEQPTPTCGGEPTETIIESALVALSSLLVVSGLVAAVGWTMRHGFWPMGFAGVAVVGLGLTIVWRTGR